MTRIKSKKIIIIGGTSGIGKAIVEKFSHEGGHIIFCGRSEKNGHEIATQFSNTHYEYCDITNQNSVNKFFDNAMGLLNGLDIAINNAGISGDIVPFHQTGDDLLSEVMETNFFGI